MRKLCEDHTTPVKHLRSMIETKYNVHKPSYYKVWDAKKKGDCEDVWELERVLPKVAKVANGIY